MFHVTKGAFDIVGRFADGVVVDIKKAHHNSLRYMLKQRVQLDPEFEKTRPDIFRPRQPGDYIPGTRLSVTKAAKALVPDAEKPPRRVARSPRPLGLADGHAADQLVRRG